MDPQPRFILDLSWTAIAKIALVAFVLYLIYLIGSLFILVLFALIISILFAPVIDYLENRRVPRSLSVVLLYGGAFLLLGLLIYLSLPVFVVELQKFVKVLPQYFEKFAPPFRLLGLEAFSTLEGLIDVFEKSLRAASASIFAAIAAIFGGIFTTIFVVTTAAFLSLEKRPVEGAINLLAPRGYENAGLEIWRKAKKKVAGWFLSRILASLFVGVATYLALLFLDVPYPMSLSILGGLLNFIPYLGPFAAGLMIFFLSALQEPFLGVLAVLAFTVIQQIENNIITPILTQRLTGLSPTLTLVAFAIGGTLWGLLGAILAIPLFVIVLEVVRDVLELRRPREQDASGDALPYR